MATPQQTDEAERGSAPLSRLLREDAIVSLVLIAVCAVLFWDTTRWPEVPPSLAQNAPPTVFPRMLIGLVFVLAIALPFERLWKRRNGEELAIGGDGWPKPIVFVTIGVILAAVYSMSFLGVLPIMVAIAAIMPILWGERRYAVVAAYAIGIPILVALLFAVGLKVNLAFGLTGDVFRWLR